MSFEDLFNSIKKIAGDIKCLITKVDIIAGAGTGTQDYEAGNYTILCDSANPNIYYLAYFTSIDGVKENHYITLPSGVDTVGNLPATAMPCKEPKVITSCYKANGILYTNILCISGTSVVASLWLNMADNSISTTMPSGATTCVDFVDRVNADHANGCIERTTEVPSLVCGSTQSVYSFGPNDLVGFTITARDGNGNFTATQEHASGVHAQFMALFNSMLVDNTRMEENIGNGQIIFNFWEGNVANVIDVSPTVIQFDFHLEPNVSDTPDALISPCTDPIPNSAYQSTASQITSLYNSVPLNTLIPNNGIPITFTVTQYSQSAGDPVKQITYIPAKQVVVYDALGEPVSDKYYAQGTLTPIPFNPDTDIFKNNCKEPKEKIAIAVEPHCATKAGASGTAFYLVYKGSYQDYLNSGGDPNAVDLGTFANPYDGWLYAGICAASLPNSVDNWEWSSIASPIYGYNGGNQYGPLTLIPNGNTLTCGIQQKNIEKIKYDDDSIRWVEDSSDLKNLIDFDTTGWDVMPGICPMPIIPEIDLIKDNWLPYCIDGVQWYVKEVSTFNNNTGIESTPTKIYKQGADGTIVTTAPTGTVIEEGYCSIKTSCASVGDVTAIPSKVLSKTEIDTIMFNLLGANVPKQYAGFTSISFPQTINYQGTSGNIFFGYNLDLSKYKCGKNVKADIKLMYTPLGDSDPVDNGLDIIFLAANQSYTPLDFTSIIDGTAFPAFPTKVITKLYPTLPTTIQTIAAGYDISGLDSINILSYVQGMSATDKVQIEGIYLEVVSGDFSECGFVLPVQDCNSESILNALRTLVEQATQKIKRVPEMFPGSGTTPLVIPEGAISISITRLSGTVKVKGYNGQDFLLTATNENFYDGVNEAVSILGAYTIEGATSTSSYKIHILR